MINQFEINNYAKKQVDEYLAQHNLSLKDAMDTESHSAQIAAMLHGGFPKMVQKIYSLAKFQTFFWEKRDLLHNHLVNRFAALEKQAAKKAK
ncbi:hypothetical protein QG083_00065 [Kingella kingae]|uniref:hypothetical protein n=1 Tax=Kingella kingae TaxID=504 RepID=UPI00041356C6|nr:hypothetical protein [Kingella kingae]MDK4527526.1 hypothetical protein [Kingella kingae]MDK4530258.1 hypothetical protein [Kingella kingae]MDK4542253.1 hypothetical protein [Kingella kingae]MDK4561663.1 hypothetical protein [Kingella kingae]MDK4579973.1 hypothetical protein [Kingella kingae]